MRKPKSKEKTKGGRNYRKTKKLNEAYREAVKEIAEERVEEIKAMVRETLESIRSREDQRRRLDEELKFLRADIEDLKRGRLAAIKKRHDESERTGVCAHISKIHPAKIESLFVNTTQALSPNSFTVSNGSVIGSSAAKDAWTSIVTSANTQ